MIVVIVVIIVTVCLISVVSSCPVLVCFVSSCRPVLSSVVIFIVDDGGDIF